MEKISYEEAQDSIEILKLLKSIKKQFEQISLETDCILIDDEDRINASKIADQTQDIIDKAEEILSGNHLCTTCAEPLMAVEIASSDEIEYFCKVCG